MYTELNIDNKKVEFITQQYAVGLYVAVYENGNIVDQYGVDVDEKQFHNDLKEEFKDNVVFQG